MSVSLQKGQKVDLTKGNAGLRRVMVGLGWDEAKPDKKGIFSEMFSSRSQAVETIDCDAMAFLLDSTGKIANKKNVVFFNNLRHESGCVTHLGDNLTGEGKGDDEQIMIDLSNLPAHYQRIVIIVSIYQATQKNQQFGMIENAFIRIVDADKGNELCIYNLSENYGGAVAMVFGELYRRNGEWKFNAIGQPLNVWSVSELTQRYGLNPEVWRKS